jgi:hypothetical protein
MGWATRTGHIAAAIRLLGLDPAATMERLFTLYDAGELKLARSPDKTFLFTTRDLRDEDVHSIVDDIGEKVRTRLAGFNSFVELVEAGADPCLALAERFGGSHD